VLNRAIMNGVKNSKLVQSINRLAVLRAIRDHGQLSKTELCEATGLSHPTVAAIVDGLCREGFVDDAGYGNSSGGRKPAIFEFNPRARYIIGVDFKRDNVVLGVADLAASIIKRRTIDNLSNVEVVADGIAALVEELGRERIVSIGVGVRGFIDDHTGSLQWITNTRKTNIPLKKLLEKRTGCDVFIDHNYNLAALGERNFGAGRKARDLIYINVGTGISAGLIINGHIYRGRLGQAGEFGHTVVDINGSPCECGRRGCLESLVSGAALAKAAVEALQRGDKSNLTDITEGNLSRINGAHIIECADKGDSLCLELSRRAGEILGAGIVNLINLFNPEMIIVGGSLIRPGGVLMKTLAETVDRDADRATRQDFKLVASELGGDAVLIGVATLVLEDWLQLSLEGVN
jgi:glucokinase-like ROK family protein